MTISFLNLVCRQILAATLFFVGFGHALADTVRISGVGLSAPLMQRLSVAYRKLQPGDTITVVLPPLGSDGALRALAAGELDLAVSGRPAKPEELVNIGKVSELASTPFGFATRDGVRAAGLTRKDVADIYAGTLLTWDDGRPIRLIMRAERETDTKLVRALSLETNAAVDIAMKRKGLVVADNDLDMLRLLETVSGSFGPITTGLIQLQDSKLRQLPLDGVLPEARALAEGRYPLAKGLYLALQKAPNKGSARFVAFLQSAVAQDIITGAAFAPAKH